MRCCWRSPASSGSRSRRRRCRRVLADAESALARAARRRHLRRSRKRATCSRTGRPRNAPARSWSVLWALPRDQAIELSADVVQAPTPTEEPLSLPALLLATFPLDPTRRHVAQGPLDRSAGAGGGGGVRRAAAEPGRGRGGRAAAGADRAGGGGVRPGAQGRDRLAVLPGTPMLAGGRGRDLAAEPPGCGRGRRCGRCVQCRARADRARARAVRPAGPDRLGRARSTAARPGRPRRPARRGGGDESPEWWRAASTRRSPAWSRIRCCGRPSAPCRSRWPTAGSSAGSAGCCCRAASCPTDVLATFGEYGVRVVHPEAVHESLERLGALPATPRSLLEDSAVRTAVEHSAEADDPDADRRRGPQRWSPPTRPRPKGLWWLSDLVLRDADGELVPANALVIPGSAAEAVLDDEEVAPIDRALLDRYGQAALEAVGVLATPRRRDGLGRRARRVARSAGRPRRHRGLGVRRRTGRFAVRRDRRRARRRSATSTGSPTTPGRASSNCSDRPRSCAARWSPGPRRRAG